MVLDTRQIRNEDVPQEDSSGSGHLPLKSLLKVKAVPDLTRLGHALAILEPLPAVVGDCILSSFDETTVHQVAADQGACSAFASIAVDKHDILLRLIEEVEHPLTSVEKEPQSRTVMVFPVMVYDPTVKWRLIILLA